MAPKHSSPPLPTWIVSCIAAGACLGVAAQTQPQAPAAPPLAVTPTAPGAMVPAIPQAVLTPQRASAPAEPAIPPTASPSAPAVAASVPNAVPNAVPASAAASVAAAPPPPPKRVEATWLDEPLGLDPNAWRYSAALDLLGAPVQAEPLRRILLQRHLAQLRGETPDPKLTVRGAIVLGERASAPDADNELRVRWAELMNQHMRIGMPGQAAVKVPAELEADSARLREAAPGLWSLHAADGTVRSRIWWVKLHNQGKLPLALAEFRVRAPAGNDQTQFDCTLPRYQESALAPPGQDTAYICRANAGVGTPKAFDDLARALRSQSTMQVRLEPRDLEGSTPATRVMMRLEGPQRAAAEALAALADQQALESPRTPRPRGMAAAPSGSASAAASAGGGKLRWVAVAVGAVALFSLLAAMAGRRAAVATSWILMTIGAAMVAFKGVPTAWSLVPRAGAGEWSMWQAALFTALVPGLVTLALTVVHEVLFGERIGLLRGVAATVAEVVVDPVVDRLFSGRR